jgi:hypothetical protein
MDRCNSTATGAISSNQVVEVPLLKPKCADFCGTDLNSWLKWLAEKQCEYDWSTVDVTCLQQLLDTCADCNQDLKTIIENLIEAVCQLNTNFNNLESSLTPPEVPEAPCCTRTEITLDLLDRWEDVLVNNPAKAFKQDGRVFLQGQIDTGSVFNVMFNLPAGWRPAQPRYLPVCHNYSTADIRGIRIAQNGDATLVIVGTPTVQDGFISLDGLNFFI